MFLNLPASANFERIWLTVTADMLNILRTSLTYQPQLIGEMSDELKNQTQSVDKAYSWMYNRIKSQEGELTMFRYCFNVVDNKSGNPMQWHGVGLTLSYSFLG